MPIACANDFLIGNFIKANKMKNLIGKKFGRLTVKSLYSKKQRLRNGKKDGYFYKYFCECNCGNETIVSKEHLLSGHTQSCGCFQKEKCLKLNGLYVKNRRLYYIWHAIKERCFNKNNSNYKNYGGRGITICKAWYDSFNDFYFWAINNGYKNNLTIERIDVNGNYEPSNCRWISKSEQTLNKRTSVNIEIDGKKQCLKLWCDEFNVPRHLVYWYMKKFNIGHKESLLMLRG